MPKVSLVGGLVGGVVLIVFILAVLATADSMAHRTGMGGEGCSFLRCGDIFAREESAANRAGGKMMGDFYYDEDSVAVGSPGMAISEPYPMPPMGGDTAAEAGEQHIIKTADLALAVDGVDAKVQEAVTMVTGRGGFVQSSTVMEDDNGQKTGYVVVRVPVATFEETVTDLKGLASRVDRESINGQDVTENYTDIEARLRSAKAQEDQYLQILDRATTVQDILAVQQYLQSIRYEIESLEGQLESLGNQTEYSTISLTMYEETRIEIPANKFDLEQTVKEAGRALVLLAQAALTVLIWFVIIGGAFVLPVALIAMAVVKVAKHLKRRK